MKRSLYGSPGVIDLNTSSYRSLRLDGFGRALTLVLGSGPPMLARGNTFAKSAPYLKKNFLEIFSVVRSQPCPVINQKPEE
jgi:hypothetical protein